MTRCGESVSMGNVVMYHVLQEEQIIVLPKLGLRDDEVWGKCDASCCKLACRNSS